MQYIVKLSGEQPLLDQLLTKTVVLFLSLDWGKGFYLYYILLVQVLFFSISWKTEKIYFYISLYWKSILYSIFLIVLGLEDLSFFGFLFFSSQC